jgi:hypothetical protein
MKSTMRKIRVNGEVFVWKREHLHGKNPAETGCTEKVTVYLEGFKRSPLYVYFHEKDNRFPKEATGNDRWIVGYPEDGVIWLSTDRPQLPPGQVYSATEQQTKEVNLNRPAVIEILIRYFREKGWNPDTDTKPFVEDQALNLLETNCFDKLMDSGSTNGVT